MVARLEAMRRTKEVARVVVDSDSRFKQKNQWKKPQTNQSLLVSKMYRSATVSLKTKFVKNRKNKTELSVAICVEVFEEGP